MEMELITENVVETGETSAIAEVATNTATRNKNLVKGGIALAVVSLGGVVLWKKVIKPWREKRKAAKAKKAEAEAITPDEE